MRILLSFGFVAAVSATAGAQLGGTTFAAPDAPEVVDATPLVAAPQSQETVERHRRDRRFQPDDNPYVTLGFDDAMLGTRDLGDIGPAPGLEGNPYARLGVARPHLAGNPYFVTSLDDSRDRGIDDGRPVVLESNPYVY